MSLQDLPLETLINIAKRHPWTCCELSKTVRCVGLFSIENDMKAGFKFKTNKETFFLVKNYDEPYYKKSYDSWDDNPAVIELDGSQWWYKEGMLHRDNDKPAIVWSNGSQAWYKEDNKHREADKPAIICSDGTQEWYKEGNRHRDNDRPAITRLDGTKIWYKNGKLHRDNDKPAVMRSNGIVQWYKDGKQYYPSLGYCSEGDY